MLPRVLQRQLPEGDVRVQEHQGAHQARRRALGAGRLPGNTHVSETFQARQPVCDRHEPQRSWAYGLSRAVVPRLPLSQFLQQGVLHQGIICGAQARLPHHLQDSSCVCFNTASPCCA